jgi:hypothetical protein
MCLVIGEVWVLRLACREARETQVSVTHLLYASHGRDTSFRDTSSKLGIFRGTEGPRDGAIVWGHNDRGQIVMASLVLTTGD